MDLQTPSLDALRLQHLKEDLRRAAYRGVAKDVLGAYGRLLTLMGRSISAVPPRMALPGMPLVPFGQIPTRDRERVLDLCIGPALGNPGNDALWRDADATMKGWALAEADLWTRRAANAVREAEAADTDEDYELCVRLSESRAMEAHYFDHLAHGIEWGQ